MSKQSPASLALAIHLRELFPTASIRKEFRFHQGRQWRFDFCIPTLMLAIELEGGTWIAGRHSRGKGFENDCRKYAQAIADGWRVFRFTTGMILKGEEIPYLKQWIVTHYIDLKPLPIIAVHAKSV